MSRIFKIAIDGLWGSGRRTTGQLLAIRLNFCFIDHDAMAKAVVLKCHDYGVKIGDEASADKIAELAKKSDIRFPSLGEVELDGRNITEIIKRGFVLRDVKSVMATPGVREALIQQQRILANCKKTGAAYDGFMIDGKQYRGSVLAGHDICSLVLPEANVKVFLKADFDTRAQRLFEKYNRDMHRPCRKTLEDIQNGLKELDSVEYKKYTADDLVTIDTTNLTSDEQVRKVQDLVLNKIQ
ncbi:cytidylate kinase [Backusella circina FSU 941]|nr:cytidylate kinase [Backusella circina FSU 941]